MRRTLMIVTGLLCVLPTSSRSDEPKPAGHESGGALIRSAASGPWSAPTTWQGGKVPGAGSRVQVRTGHTVTYDVSSDQVIRLIHGAGTLRFDPSRDTRLDVGLIKIQSGDDSSENGFDCDAHAPMVDPN